VGEIIVLAVLIVVMGGVGTGLAAAAKTNRKERLDATETPEYRNHLAMARWIEHTLEDDMERVVVPEARQKRARTLLADFYKEER
jgi:hypothetical protein